ncbi:MAG: hypothetical protein OEW18_14370 [Candidatus Aminicenantes bacterium]|nr:hypothetical protein [Candidatus Aminicenantes bacterium]
MTQNFVRSLTALAKALRSIPGQKHVILFSRGVPNSLIYGNQVGAPDWRMEQTGGREARTQFDMGDPRLKGLNETMFKEFAAAGCAICLFIPGYTTTAGGSGLNSVSMLRTRMCWLRD